MKTKTRTYAYAAIATVLCLFAGCASQPKSALPAAQVPEPVKQAFAAKFPAAKDVEWSLKSDKNYEAEFGAEATATAVKFDPAGKWLETETTISGDKLPKAFQDAAAAQFKGYKVVETQSLVKASEQAAIYELHLDNGKEIVKAQFSAAGEVLNKSAKPKAGA